MAFYYKISTRIWWDEEFKLLSSGEKFEVIRKVVFGEPLEGFAEYRGPRFRVADTPHKRPDLFTMKWKRLRKEVIADGGAICFYCGEDCSDGPTVDHVVPVCRGGALYEKSNLVVSCRSCNSRKGGKEAWT